MSNQVWDEITYPFQKFNGKTIEVCEFQMDKWFHPTPIFFFFFWGGGASDKISVVASKPVRNWEH